MQKILPLLLTLLLLAACGTTKQAVDDTTFPQKVAATALTQEYLTAHLNLEANGDGEQLSCSGTLRMKRNDVIQLQLAFMGFAVGTLEFTPDSVLLIDKLNSQYVRATYRQIDFLRRANVDFHVLQALFWHELFVPGEPDILSQLQRFTIADDDKNKVLTLSDSPLLDYQFTAASRNGLIERVTITPQATATTTGATAAVTAAATTAVTAAATTAATTGAAAAATAPQQALQWVYGDYTPVGRKKFPQQMLLDFSGNGHDAQLSLTLSTIGSTTKWNTRTPIPEGYPQRDANALFRLLLGI